MNLNHLRFVIWDNLLFSSPLDYPSLHKLINYQTHPLSLSHQKGLQLHLSSLLLIIDQFFNSDSISDIITMKHSMFSDEELGEIQNKAVELRVLIECQKVYAGEYWVNNKREWVVEVRILATLVRVYGFVERLWAFFVERQHDTSNRHRISKIILPLSKLEPFINDIFTRLQKIQMCYYLTQFPYLVEIHVLFKAWRELLTNFPSISRKDIVKDFKLRLIVLAQNEKYKKVYKERMLTVPESPMKIKREREKEEERVSEKERGILKIGCINNKRSRSFNDNDLWHRKILIPSTNQKRKKHKSLQPVPISFLSPLSKRPIVRFTFQPLQLRRRSKHPSLLLKQRTISSCTSHRYPSFSKSILLPSKLSTTDDFTNDLSSKIISSPRETVFRQTMSPSRIPKTRGRRMETVGNVEKVVEQKNPMLRGKEFERYGREKEQGGFTFIKHYEGWIRQERGKRVGKGNGYGKGESIMVGEEGVEIKVKEGKIGMTYEEMEEEVEIILRGDGVEKKDAVKRKDEYQQQL